MSHTRPIRFALWLLALAALAVAVVLAGRYATAYVIFVIPPWGIEISLILFVFSLVLLFGGTYLLLRLGEGARRLPRELRALRQERARGHSRDVLYASFRALFEGEFAEAERLARSVMKAESVHEGTRDLGAAVAAWAAHEGGNSQAAVPYLERIHGGRSVRMRDASKAYMLLAEGRAKDALTLLKGLAATSPRNPGVLKMKMEAELAVMAWEDVLATLDPLTKSGLMPETAAAQIRLNAERHLLASRKVDAPTLLGMWRDLGKESRQDADIATIVAKRLIDMGHGDEARALIEETIDARGNDGWDSTLVAVYADCKSGSTLEQIEHAEMWLRQHARDPVLLATLGKLCMRQGLWGKAQSYLEASAALSPTLDSHMTLARLMEQTGRKEEAIRHIRRCVELAA